VVLHPRPTTTGRKRYAGTTDLLDSDVVGSRGDVPEPLKTTPMARRPAVHGHQIGSVARDPARSGDRSSRGGAGGLVGFRPTSRTKDGLSEANFIEAARQTALNLTTIDWEKAENDVTAHSGRATGEFTTISPSGRSRSSMWSSKQVDRGWTITEAGLEWRQPGQPLCWWR